MSENTPVPKPHPVPRPVPGPAHAKPAPAPSPLDSAAAREAATWGRVDDDGNVWLRSSEGERIVGQYAASGSSEDALAIYVRRYLDLDTQVSLLEARVETISPEEATKGLKTLDKELTEPAAIGDIASLRTRVDALRGRVEERREIVAQQRKAAKEEAMAAREAIVERAEAIVAQDPAQTHWRNSREELQRLFEQWQKVQREGPRIDRAKEDAYWQRFSRARSAFDRARRKHFAAVDAERAEVIARKEKLIAEAEELSTSTDWSGTARAYRDLMDRWRVAGHAARRDDNKLWDRFRAAQQPFFDARSAAFSERDSEQAANLEAKLELLKEAEALLPVKNPEAARAKLRDIGARWDEIGHVPRADIARTEGRMRDIEAEINSAENEQWKRTDPEKQHRSDGMAAQLEHLIEQLDEEIAVAKEKGDEKKLRELTDARQARVAWLEQVQKEL